MTTTKTRESGNLRLLTMEMARVTESAALAASQWMGKGDKWMADDAATKAMRAVLGETHIKGTVVIGEGELDEAPMLYIGETLGTGEGPEVDIAVDPLEGTNLLATGAPGAITVLAIAPRGSLLHAPDMYMEKIAVGPRAKGAISLERSVRENILAVAEANGKRVQDMVIVLLNRPRNDYILKEIRALGARARLIPDGDVSPALAACFEETGIDMMMGIGGAPEGVVTAVAMKSLGGDFQGRLWIQDDVAEEEIRRLKTMGIDDPRQLLTMDDLVRSDDAIFSATGVTDGLLLPGIRFTGRNEARSVTLVARARTRTIRLIHGHHHLDLKPEHVREWVQEKEDLIS